VKRITITGARRPAADMAIVDYTYLGSLQTEKFLETENPMEEVWSILSLYGSEEFLQQNLILNKASSNKDALVDYIAVRIRQAGELRTATRQATLLTAPLTLYYSILNLTRACLAIEEEEFSTGHGLKFKEDRSILNCHAEIVGGTFSKYLEVNGFQAPKQKVKVSLDDCLSRIVEMAENYFTIVGKPSLVSPVRVKAFHTGKTFLTFRADAVEGVEHFGCHWRSEFPSLAPHCEQELQPDECILKVKKEKEPNDYEGVCSLCKEMLETRLIFSDSNPTWAILRQTNSDLVWPRAAYYFAALFILSSIVRYQPELIYQINSANTKSNWLLLRFMATAERFYPHLMLNWIHKTNYFFRS